MRRVRYSVACSLDGFIAGPNGESDWIVMDPAIDFRALMASFDTILMGRKTFEAAQGKGGGGGMPGMSAYVISTTLAQNACKGATVSANPRDLIASLKAKPGRDIWLFGGGGLFASLLDQGLVDSIELAVIPVLLGRGLPVAGFSERRHKLKLVKHKLYEATGTVSLDYTPALQPPPGLPG